jgi:hypothetical protein
MDFKRTTDIQVVQNTNHITLDDLCFYPRRKSWKVSGSSVQQKYKHKNGPGRDTLSKKVKGFVNKQPLDNLPKVYLNDNRTHSLEEQSKPKNRPYGIIVPLEQNTLISIFCLGGNLIMYSTSLTGPENHRTSLRFQPFNRKVF